MRIILLLLALTCLTGCNAIKRDLFLKTQSFVTVQADPPTGGVVSASGGIASYQLNGDLMVIGATPFKGWDFVRWNDGNTNANRTFLVPRNRTINFVAKFDYKSVTPH